MANSTELKPYRKPTDVASPVTSAVWDEGMPPGRMKKRMSRRFSLIRPSTTFSVWAMNQALAAISRLSLKTVFKTVLA